MIEEKIETIWASKKKRVLARAQSLNLQDMQQKEEIRKIRDKKTLRDEFAMRAMQQLVYFSSQAKYDKQIRGEIYKDIAASSYEMADAMIEIRGK